MLEVCKGNQGEMKGPVFRLITSPLLEWDSGGNLDITLNSKHIYCPDMTVNMTLTLYKIPLFPVKDATS